MSEPRTAAAARFRLAQRGGVPPLHVMRVIDAVVARRAAGRFVIDLSAGQPSTPAPAAVRAAADAGCEWLHVDYEPHLTTFYLYACGFTPTDAGLLKLR